MQRDTALFIRFGAGHLGAVETSGDLDLDTFSAAAKSSCDRLLYGAAIGETAFELIGYLLSDELRILLSLLHFDDIDENLLGCDLLEIDLELLDLVAFLSDKETGTRSMYIDVDLVSKSFDSDLGDADILMVLGYELLDREVFVNVLGIPFFVLVPDRVPGFIDA